MRGAEKPAVRSRPLAKDACLTPLEAVKAKVHVWMLRVDHYQRLANLLALVSLPFRRPALVGANLLSKLSVVLGRLELLFSKLQYRCLKIENRLLRLEKSRLDALNGLPDVD